MVMLGCELLGSNLSGFKVLPSTIYLTNGASGDLSIFTHDNSDWIESLCLWRADERDSLHEFY